MSTTQHYSKALTIAGSDSGGGAGIQADLKSFSANGVYGMSAITAITAQNTKGVQAIHPVPVDIIQKQIASVMEDIGADAVKTGMLHSSEVIHAIRARLDHYRPPYLVVDPVMVATSGDKLLEDEAIETMIHVMLPQATLITPNLPEAEVILGRKLETPQQTQQAARDLAKTGARGILLKSGHSKGNEVTDLLYLPESDRMVELPKKRIHTQNTHGTGCTLASAIAAWLARGLSLEQASRKGLDYTHYALQQGANYHLGQGNGPVHHFYQFWS